MSQARFEWDERKDDANRVKHGVFFTLAQHAFLDPQLVTAEDTRHSLVERRYFCFGQVGGGVLTVRFTHREGVLRIIGAGYRRKGKAIYEQQCGQVHR